MLSPLCDSTNNCKIMAGDLLPLFLCDQCLITPMAFVSSFFFAVGLYLGWKLSDFFFIIIIFLEFVYELSHVRLYLG
jgi:hypothetical protein